jgi:hypothetical protein
MAECAVCGETLDLPHECEHCGEIHCSDHRLPESHECVAVTLSSGWAGDETDDTPTRREQRSIDPDDLPDREPDISDEARGPDVAPDGSIAEGTQPSEQIETVERPGRITRAEQFLAVVIGLGGLSALYVLFL